MGYDYKALRENNFSQLNQQYHPNDISYASGNYFYSDGYRNQDKYT